MLTTLALCLTAAAPAAPRTVYVGAYLSDVSDFDLKAGRFKADLHVWVKWMGDEQAPVVTFENAEIDTQDELGREREGNWHSRRWRVQGTFRGEFPVHTFPFDRQTLPVVFGLTEADGVLVPDLGASGMSEAFSVTGWDYEPYFSARTTEKVWGSDLGRIDREGQNARRRQVAFSVELRRPFGPYLIKFALPLGLILLVALLALFLPADRLDVRSGMGITALLSCIAFHYTQADTLPAVTYLVAADKLFLGAYVFVAGTLTLSVAAFRFHDRPVVAQAMDRLGLWLLPLGTAGGVISLVSSSLAPGVAVAAGPTAVRASQPVLRVAASQLDSATAHGQVPSRRAVLVTRGADGHSVPVLAEEAPAMTNDLVRLLPDGGMRIRWRLHPLARWSDGAPITADDLVASVTAVEEPLRRSVVKVDERTIDVTYGDRRSAWLDGFPVYPRPALAALDGGREGLSQQQAEGTIPTSAPYVLEGFTKGERLTLARVDQFPHGRPVFERIEARVMDPAAAAEALVRGEVDVIPVVTPEVYHRLAGAEGVKVLEQPGELLWVMVPSGAPWNTREMRRALFSVLHRDVMAAALAPMPARAAWGWRAGPPPAGARASPSALVGLVGLTVDLHVAKISSPDAPHAVLAREVVKDLERAGLRVRVVERDGLYQVVRRGDFTGLALISRDTSDPSRFMTAGGSTTAAAVDPALAGPFARYQASLYDERRAALEMELQRTWFEQLPALPLVLTSRLAAVRSAVVGPEWGSADSLWWNVAQWDLGR